jgi:hypothetical protein
MREAVRAVGRFIAICRTAKHLVFQWVDAAILVESKIIAIATDDALVLGVLSSRVHIAWSIAAGSHHGVGNDLTYNNTLCFVPFPFPIGTDAQRQRIRQFSEALDVHRKRQQVLHDDLTVTTMYNVLEKLRAGTPLHANERQVHEKGLVAVLQQIHDDLDAAVFDAYGWPHDLTDEQILERLVALNAERAEEERNGLVRWLRPEFQNPHGEKAGQPVLVDAGGKKAVKGKVAKAQPSAWPKDLPSRIGAVRATIESRRGGLSIDDVASAFKGARRTDVESILESLSRLGLARSYRDGNSTLWSAVRIA